MNITKHNCESWFLDYYEKTLSPVEVAEVLFFLEENPELKELFESYESVFLEHEKVNFPDKESLKKKFNKEELDFILSSEINIHNCEQFFVAGAEGLLSSGQTSKLYSFLSLNPGLIKDFDLIKKCILEPGSITFEHKDSLKKATINAENREEYFIRSAEGDLNFSEQKSLSSFLEQNPEYSREFELFKQTILPAEKVTFNYKNGLRKEEITAENREEYFARALDRDLNAGEQKNLSLFLNQNPSYKKEFELFGKTVLIPEKISFGYKEELKKRERKPVFVALFSQQRTYYAAAAAILLLAGLFFFFGNNSEPDAYLANAQKTPVKEVAQNSIQSDKENPKVSSAPAPAGNAGEQPAVKMNISVKKSSGSSLQESAQEEIAPQQSPVENKVAEPMQLANNTEEKKSEQPEANDPALASNTEEKKDTSSAAPVVPVQAVAASAAKANADEYQTLASAVNKKIRSVLGIKNSSECETSDKIGLWELAVAAKNGIQRIAGIKTLEMNKVCDGNGENVEYVFVAGNFEINKNASK
jgi:hypothetical protein